MENYDRWQDFMDTFQSVTSGVQVASIALPLLFLFGLAWLVVWYLRERRRLALIGAPGRGRLVCTIVRNADGELGVYVHDKDATDLIRAQIGLALPEMKRLE